MTTIERPAPVDVPDVEAALSPRPPRQRRPVGKILVTVALSLLTIAFIYPFVWLLSASLKPRGDVFDNKLIPDVLTFDNYLEVWRAAPLGMWLFNTALVTVLATVAVHACGESSRPWRPEAFMTFAADDDDRETRR